jgi:hypothetical protein
MAVNQLWQGAAVLTGISFSQNRSQRGWNERKASGGIVRGVFGGGGR